MDRKAEFLNRQLAEDLRSGIQEYQKVQIPDDVDLESLRVKFLNDELLPEQRKAINKVIFNLQRQGFKNVANLREYQEHLMQVDNVGEASVDFIRGLLD